MGVAVDFNYISWREVDDMIAGMAAIDPKLFAALNPSPTPSAVGTRRLMSYFSDPCVCWPTGLSMYCLAAFLHVLFSWFYYQRGYSRHVSGGLVYWYRPGNHSSDDNKRSDDGSRSGTKKASGKEKLPVAFFPGVGAGCLMYDMILDMIEKKVNYALFYYFYIEFTLCEMVY
jgi:hypothetical protein